MTQLDTQALEAAPTHRHKKRGTEYVLIGYGLWTGINQYVEDDADLSVKEVAPGVWSVCEQYERPTDGEWARLQTNRHLNLADAMAIYRSVDDGSLWARPREEFEDGRFEALPASKPAKQEPVAWMNVKGDGTIVGLSQEKPDNWLNPRPLYASAPSQPVGDWVLVPRKPTEAMNMAGSIVGDYPWDGQKPSRIYRAMLASAPSAPVAEVGEPDAVSLLRGPLSKRATSAEFNEWQAREVVSYIDQLRALTLPPQGVREAALEEAATIARHVGGEFNMLQNDNVEREANIRSRDVAYEIERRIRALKTTEADRG